MKDTAQKDSALRRALRHAAEPHILFPAIALVVLGILWTATGNLAKLERTSAERAAALASHESADTYEAQVVRALREIDQALKLVAYARNLRGTQATLQELKARTLLPPDLLFTVAIADAGGTIMAQTRASGLASVAGMDVFEEQRRGDAFVIGHPRRKAGTEGWWLDFSRRLDDEGGRFAGIALATVDAAYFVSGYDEAKLGRLGMLALLGTDGIFRVRRTGDTVSAGVAIDYAATVHDGDDERHGGELVVNPWDGRERYTSAHKLFEFPLAVVVGLSAEEQLAGARANIRTYLWRAAAASVVAILILTMLARMSRELARTRMRVAEEHQANAVRAEHLAYHDTLTGLPNRSLFSKLLVQGIAQARRNDRRLAVLFLDLDRFKHINDTLGHAAGDELLREVARRLTSCLRDSDTVARLGGDEFVALLPELGDPKYAATVARKILAAVGQPFELAGQELRVTASIGISVYPQDGLDEQALTKNADIAMYQAKGDGKDNFRFFSEALNTHALERLTLESDLRHALERGEFVLHYQAKQSARDGRITGVEALVRWHRPGQEPVAPMHFIPLAEETGLIVPIGKWILEAACLQNVAWQAEGLPVVTMAVNLSARQFTDETLVEDLMSILAKTGMEARLLELEISETLLMRDVDKALAVITALKARGLRIAIDDFGTGYAQLSRLRAFPLDAVKIDRSLIHGAGQEASHGTLAAAVIAMGRTLSPIVVAQGVELKSQADFLSLNPCDEYQGFYFNKPIPGDQMAGLMREQTGAARRAQ